ncbi:MULTISPECIES: IPExxxVDY family protein [Flavobacteriaceae]|uniref:IPExxxVDY family protein n=1 Tax=Flavobacteriaceae TaxID=49546 RepID=UPI00234B37C5|nr:IPExxxVDY family protein [Muricauda sp. SP22]MDC6362243.1 IPExxxVDY family protein [Muricauda sp. SP22]
MLTTHRISADFFDDSFGLIAIHSNLEDYAMAYGINSNCSLYLKRMGNDLHLDESFFFSVFDWEDEINDVYWTLISNSCTIVEAVQSDGLFGNDSSYRTNHLVKERKEVDYFLKVDGADETALEQKVKAINKIAKVVTAYPVEAHTLKSKRNLIF